MGSDRARDTYSEARQYRRVVPQQGRVVLEADSNEAQVIAAEAMREEALDVIGPHGVPRDRDSGEQGRGYCIHDLNRETRDFRIGWGSLYAGGWNVRQHDPALTYGDQPDWIDGPAPPLTQVQASMSEKEIVYLRLREQEVSAVEDPTLIEPALGGPDTTQRIRILRRVGRAAIPASDQSVRQRSTFQSIDWGNPGIVLAPDQVTLRRTTHLSVSFDPTNQAYVGPENQMIRVQGGMRESASSTVATRLLWAYDNASSLYGAQIPDPANLAVIELINTPADTKRQPRSKQYAEVLLAAADLCDGAYAAASTGVLLQVSQGYDPKTRTIGLQAPLPAAYAERTPLFVRIWENSIDVSAAFGAAAALVDANGNATGLQVELTDETNGVASVEAGDFWSFAVRPSTPTTLYPARYFRPQRPDGPREWACPLALIDWNRRRVLDCRRSFTSLSALSGSRGCCALTLGVEDLKRKPLVEWIEGFERSEQAITVCLKPGCYVLDEPIVLGREHANVTIEACGGPAEFVAAEHARANFGNGLLQLYEADRVTLRGLRFVLPEASFRETVAEQLSGFDPESRAARHAIFRMLGSIRLSIGLQIGACANLTVEGCTFVFQPGHERRRRSFYGGGIVATGSIRGLKVGNCVFRSEHAPRDDEPHLRFGYLHAPPAEEERVLLAYAAADQHGHVFMHPEFAGYSTTLAEASFCQNTFDGLTAAALVFGHIGQLKIAENRVRDCYGGFWLFASNRAPFEPEGHEDHREILVGLLEDPNVYWALALARCLHRLSTFQTEDVARARFGLHVHDNAMEVAGAAIIGWYAGGDDGASVIVNANRLTSAMRALPTGAIVTAPYASLTGNVLVNFAEGEEGHAAAFVISHGRIPCLFAASGNVHKGVMLLPRRGVLDETAEDFSEPPRDPETHREASRPRPERPPPRPRTRRK